MTDTIYDIEFVGECTCEHDPDDHGWGRCDVILEDGTRCPCQAGWVE